MNEQPLNERMAIAETEIEVIKTDITGIKSDVNQLKNAQFETNLSIKELTVLLSENNKMHAQVLQQNTETMAELRTTINESNKKNDDRYTELLTENNRQNIEIKTKKEKFIGVMYDIGLSVFKLAVAGGLLYYIFNISKVIKF